MAEEYEPIVVPKERIAHIIDEHIRYIETSDLQLVENEQTLPILRLHKEKVRNIKDRASSCDFRGLFHDVKALGATDKLLSYQNERTGRIVSHDLELALDGIAEQLSLKCRCTRDVDIDLVGADAWKAMSDLNSSLRKEIDQRFKDRPSALEFANTFYEDVVSLGYAAVECNLPSLVNGLYMQGPRTSQLVTEVVGSFRGMEEIDKLAVDGLADLYSKSCNCEPEFGGFVVEDGVSGPKRSKSSRTGKIAKEG